jgi:hypothetical protein
MREGRRRTIMGDKIPTQMLVQTKNFLGIT